MSLNATPSGERINIGFFGVRNAGKSSLVNRITGQKLSVVSDVLGTTTDPVKKAMELLPLGPVMIYDTPGIDDEGALGAQRIEKTKDILKLIDIAVVVRVVTQPETSLERELIAEIKSKNIPFLVALNKSDKLEVPEKALKDYEILVSAETGQGVEALKQRLSLIKPNKSNKTLISDKIERGDTVVLVTPIDESAPKGRLILPQQQTIRDIIDTGAIAVTCQPEELSLVLDNLKKAPRMVITDSQVFREVEAIVPKDIPLTSFSILFARYKGELDILMEGGKVLTSIKSSDKILISEGCTHKRQCGDIGSVKIPNLIRKFTGENPQFHFTSGGEFPKDLSGFKVIIHCGGCMLSEREMLSRLSEAKGQNIPIVNYGIAIAYMNGILERSTEIFK